MVQLRRYIVRNKWMLTALLVLGTWFALCLPRPLFNTPASYVLLDAEQNLLSAAVADDGQWRFFAGDTIPYKFAACLVAFEDKRFYYHPGVDPLAIARAIYQNLQGSKVVSGGSTITMQVLRLSRPAKRNVVSKCWEAIRAIRLECSYTKPQILALYAANAPFGGNVVGLEAAAWRYFGRRAHQLSWAEAATLAVLPNAPALVHPGKNRQRLLQKRNRLLQQLAANGTIDSTTALLAATEPLPSKPYALPMHAPHLLNRFRRHVAAGSAAAPTMATTTIQQPLQLSVTGLLQRHQAVFSGNGIHNIAAMVMSVDSGHVLAYVGNVSPSGEAETEHYVDVLAAPRSPGSTLKPLLYAAMQTDGLLLPKQMVPDVPVRIGGYAPQNFNLEYDGAVPAWQALSRSLNVPAVKMLQQYKYPRFYHALQQCGFTTINRPADDYGLSLVLGGCEVTPWELAGVYSSLARSYLHQTQNKGRMAAADWHMPRYTTHQPQTLAAAPQAFDYTSVWHMFNAMQEVMRPGEEGLWPMFTSAQRIAWKTGTSFGFRDGWAIGLTPKYCVVVWVGNADGEGRPGLTGINTAAPVMFDIFRMLPGSKWFEPPKYHYTWLPVCHVSGYKAAPACTQVDTVMVSSHGSNGGLCPYHRLVNLHPTLDVRVSDNCVSPSLMRQVSWFVLPAAMEYFYAKHHPNYKPLPPYAQGCTPEGGRQMELIYPDDRAKMYVPVEMDGQRGKTVFRAAHHQAGATIYWHLDDAFVGATSRFHELALSPTPGHHTLTIVDDTGDRITRRIEILGKEDSRH